MSVSTDNLLASIAAPLTEFENRLEATIAADTGPMRDAMSHIVKAGGKRLRPALIILIARLAGNDSDQIYTLAMAIEFIHTATLLHDDLIDQSPTRRGIPTVNSMFGADPAIIVGDYYFAKGANLMSELEFPLLNTVVSQTVMTICMGELLQLISKYNYSQTFEEYYQKIERKTAALLSASCYCSGLFSRFSDHKSEALKSYGHNLGMAFQISDDLLDYVATVEEMGKPVGADLRQGTVTLPLMYAQQDQQVADRLGSILHHDPLQEGDYDQVVQLVRESDGPKNSLQRAHEFAEKAKLDLEIFDDSPARQTLTAICDYVVERRV